MTEENRFKKAKRLIEQAAPGYEEHPYVAEYLKSEEGKAPKKKEK